MGNSAGFSTPQSRKNATAVAPVIPDVRRMRVFADADDMATTVRCHDPALVDEWTKDRDHAIHGVHGHEVGQNIAVASLSKGTRARYFKAGINAHRDGDGRVERQG